MNQKEDNQAIKFACNLNRENLYKTITFVKKFINNLLGVLHLFRNYYWFKVQKTIVKLLSVINTKRSRLFTNRKKTVMGYHLLLYNI